MFFVDEYIQKVNTAESSFALTDSDGKRTLTYAQLDSLVNRIANKLVSVGASAGESVIIILPRSIEYIACEIAILKTLAVAVPLIPEYPKDRVSYIEKDSLARLVIRESFFDDLEKDFSDKAPVIADSDNDGRAMIIYTSGSTGKPKGVIYTRSNLDAQIIRKLDSVKDITPLVFAASATMSFCVTVTEYLRTLAMGGHVHIISNAVRSDAALLSSYYQENEITTGFISPRMLKNFHCKSKHLKRVFTASEKVVNIYSSDFEIVNAYGQSETIGTITEFPIDKLYDNTPVGKPLKGIEVIVVDSNDEEVPDGSEGEICFIGNLPSEYNNLKEQTDKVFKKLPDGRTFIHSGDIGKKLPDGNLLYLNRNDWMIKIHGQRVEPGEIESVMNTVDGITGSIVKAFENSDGTMLLCGFYTESKTVDRETIKGRLQAALPSYMIPGAFVRMDAFPVNANGKIDRRSIERPDLSKLTAKYEKPENSTEEAICNAMQEILGIEKVGRSDCFSALGGNSLNAVDLCSKCSVPGIAPQIVMIGQSPKRIAELILENSFYPKPKFTVSNGLKKIYPLSLSQKYQYEVCKRYGKTIDCIDTVYYFKLDDSVDITRLKDSVESSVNAHVIYRSHVDMGNGQLIPDETNYSVEEISLSVVDFDSFRKSIYGRIRNLKTDPLFEAKILNIDDGETYLFMNVCHIIYDGKSMSNLLSEISARYNAEEIKAEQATMFDLIDYECSISDDKKLIKEAQKAFASNYEGLTAHALFEDEKEYSTAVSIRILEKESLNEIDDYLKEYSISILTLFQAAAEMTISKMFKTDNFCYMNVHDGRPDQLLNASHGVFAKSVFMRCGTAKHKDLRDYFKEIEEQYQRLVYYDILETFETVWKYPAVWSGITFNLRDLQGVSIKLGEKRRFSEFLDEINEYYKPFTDFDLIINRYPKGYGYLVSVVSTKVSTEFANDFIRCLDETVRKILDEK